MKLVQPHPQPQFQFKFQLRMASQCLVNRLDKTSSRYGMEISAEKIKLMTNSTKPLEKITISGQKIETVKQLSTFELFWLKTEVLARATHTYKINKKQQHWHN